MNVNKFFVFLSLFATIGFNAAAQTDAIDMQWEKLVSREIEMDSSAMHGSISLAEMMVNAIKEGKVNGYSNLDMTLTTKLSAYELRDIYGNRVDTQEITDPITNRVIRKYIRRGIDYAAIHRFRLLEHWIFDPVKCNVVITIAGIAPVREVYGDDGNFRGMQGLMWLHYNDALPILEKYNEAYARHTVTQMIWADYFSTFNKREWSGDPAGKNAIANNAIAIMNMPQQKEDMANHHLRDESTDSSLLDMLTDLKYSGRIPAWKDFEHYEGMRPLAAHEFSYPGIIKMDTLMMGSKDAGELGTLVRPVYTVGERKVKVMQRWVFDPATGKTVIELQSLAPVLGIAGNIPELMTMYWVKFADAKYIINKYDRYHPENSFAGRLWESYFRSDLKPVLVR
jgi:hypothetical protein